MIELKLDLEAMAKALATELAPQFDQINRRLDDLEKRINEHACSQEYLRPKDVEDQFKISTKTQRILAELGKIKRYDCESHARYKVSEIEAYLDRKNRRVNGTKIH